MLQLLGYRRIVVKTDQESAINALAHMVTKGRRLEKSLKDKDDQHDQSMVMRKNTVRKTQGQVWTLKAHLEEKLVRRFPAIPPSWPGWRSTRELCTHSVPKRMVFGVGFASIAFDV